MEIMVLFFIIIVVCMFVVFRVQKAREMEQENRYLQVYMLSMKEFHHVLCQRIEAVRQYKHDLAGHIQMLEELLRQEGRREGMDEYIENLKDAYSELESKKYCADEIINSVISLKAQECTDKRIPLQIKIEDIDYSRIEEIDMVGLLHNLLDNAVEENERISQTDNKERKICFQMCLKNEKIVIEVVNRVRHKEKLTFKTSKADTEAHGIGISIIQNIVDKYGGSREVIVNEAEDLLTTIIIL